MLDRCWPLRTALLALALLIPAAATAAPARAEGSIPVPADAPTILGPTASGAIVIGFLHDGRLCVAHQEGGQLRPTEIFQEEAEGIPDETGVCVAPPTVTEFGTVDLAELPLDLTDRRLIVGVTGAGGAEVEVRRVGRVVARGATVALPLGVATGELRAFALELPMRAELDEVAVRDATGTVRFASGHALSALYGLPPVPKAVLRRGRGWELRTGTRPELAATPLAPDRHVTVACVRLFVVGAADQGSLDGVCDGPDPSGPLLATGGNACSGLGNYALAIARPGVRRVVALLGDGRRATVPLTRLPGALPGTRGGGLVLPQGVALRAVLGLDAAGREIAREPLALAPSLPQLSCWPGPGSIILDDTPLAAPAPHVVRVVDSGAAICAELDAAPQVPDDCFLPPVEPSDGYLDAFAQPGGTHVIGFETTDVASVRLTLDDGARITLPAAPVAGYAGQYAATLRVVQADLPEPRRAIAVAMLDARGRVLDDSVGPQTRPLRRVAALGRPAGLPRTLRVAQSSSRRLCAGLVAPLRDNDDCLLYASHGAPIAHVVADCATHRTIVLAALRRGADRLTLRTTAGRTITAHALRLPAGLAGATRTSAVAVAVLPARAGLRDLTFHGTGARRERLGLPAAGRQCGYAMTVDRTGMTPY